MGIISRILLNAQKKIRKRKGPEYFLRSIRPFQMRGERIQIYEKLLQYLI